VFGANMKTYVKKDESANGRLCVQIPSQMESEFSKCSSVDAFMLKPGVILICTSDAKSEIFGFSNPASSIVSEQERVIINKISKIRFFERTQENTHKILNDEELATLNLMLSKKYITLFKNQKYPQGVYNIANRIFQACKNTKVVSQSKQFSIPSSSASISTSTIVKSTTTSTKPSASSTISFSNMSFPSNEPNQIEQLKKLGYMVLADEVQAKLQMQNIKEQIKDDEIRGVRGFDKRYYVAKKSFLKKYEEPIFSLLDENISNASKIASKLNLDSDAVTAFFVILSDEGLVFEKRRGEWAKV
jgi:hypothetical protein